MKRVMLFVISSVLLSAVVPAQEVDAFRETDSVKVRIREAKFVAADHFIVNHPLFGRESWVVKIHTLSNGGMPSDNFTRYLLGKTEMDVPSMVLTRYRLQKIVVDSKIRGLTGFKPLQLCYVYELLTVQPRGEPGFLLTNGGLNWFHVRGTDGRVWLLSASWRDSNGWWVQAVSSGGAFALLPGSQLISF